MHKPREARFFAERGAEDVAPYNIPIMFVQTILNGRNREARFFAERGAEDVAPYNIPIMFVQTILSGRNRESRFFAERGAEDVAPYNNTNNVCANDIKRQKPRIKVLCQAFFLKESGVLCLLSSLKKVG
ncbi:MAG: hypothetical protein IKU48_03445 [Clostridia bacterium]|nr:hypothetical protein [Clostridia bacterium]